jgi:hypothetical protein
MISLIRGMIFPVVLMNRQKIDMFLIVFKVGWQQSVQSIAGNNLKVSMTKNQNFIQLKLEDEQKKYYYN